MGFFDKLRLNAKFRQAGPGHSLTGQASSSSSKNGQQNNNQKSQKPIQNKELSIAGKAALERFSNQQAQRNKVVKPSASFNLPAASHPKAASTSTSSSVSSNSSIPTSSSNSLNKSESVDSIEYLMSKSDETLAIQYTCQLCNNLFSKDEIAAHLKLCMRELAQDDALAVALLDVYYHDQNRQRAAAIKDCMDVILKYLDNILRNPSERKYRKIRQQNKILSSQVLSLQGSDSLMQAIGFQTILEPVASVQNEKPSNSAGSETQSSLSTTSPDHPHHQQNQQSEQERPSALEPYFILPDTVTDADIQLARDYIAQGEPVAPKPQIYRCVKVFLPSEKANVAKFDLPPEFYNLSTSEVKEQQKQKREELEKSQQLRTRVMREEEMKANRKNYKYVCIRVKMPDGVVLQFLFEACEKVGAIREAIQSVFKEGLEEEAKFSLMRTPSVLDQPDNPKIAQLPLSSTDLVPASLLILRFTSSNSSIISTANILAEEYLDNVEQL